MKFYYIVINLFLMLMTASLVYLHIKHKKPKQDRIVNETPRAANSYIRGRYVTLAPPFPLKRNVDLEKGNIFHPKRGYKDPPPVQKKEGQLSDKDKENIELVGICRFNSFAAAIIHDKNKDAKQGNRAYYKVGDTLTKGYTVKSIGFDKVILSNNTTDYPLMLDRKDKNSSKRMKVNSSRLSKKNGRRKNGNRRTIPARRRNSRKAVQEKTPAQLRREEIMRKRRARFSRAIRGRK